MATMEHVSPGSGGPAAVFRLSSKSLELKSLKPRPADKAGRALIPDTGCAWWFDQDPAPRFLVDDAGALLSANGAGAAALQDGLLSASSARVLKFGSAECDASFIAAVRAVAGRGTQCRLVLRQRHGGWFGAGLHGAPAEPRVVVALQRELAPSPHAMAAVATAFHLSPSERDVLHCLLAGQCPKSVAASLNISEHTVRAHLRSLYAKMNVKGLMHLMLTASSYV